MRASIHWMKTAAVVAAAILFADAPVLASNLNFLADSPATYFNQQDKALFKDTTTTMLNEANDGESRSWSNPETKSSGEVKVLRTLPGEDKCRELEITNRAAGRKHTGRSVFCYEAKNDRWVIRPGSK